MSGVDMRVGDVIIRAALVLPLYANADCSIESGAQRPQLLELYTSEGCNSCPPADAWLSDLPASAQAAPIAFHVDYWDSARWRDRFTQPGFAARQRVIAARSRTSVYTPQLILDGRVWRGWQGGDVAHAQNADAIALRMEVHPDPLSLRWQASFANAADAVRYQAFAVLVEDGLVSKVRAGENAGKILRHDHVVRAFSGPNRALAGAATLRPRAKVGTNNARVVMWLQDPRDGSVGQLLQLALKNCQAE
jgi:hypothetical protein